MYEPGLRGIQRARKDSIESRANYVRNLVNGKNEQWLIWCGLNDEGRILNKLLPDSVLIEGKDKESDKIERERIWRSGEVQTMITKPSIFGFGMNWQHCHNVIFMGLGHSYEQYYQAIRRTWRFGQQSDVDINVVVSNIEADVVKNIQRKKDQFMQMSQEVIANMGDIETKNLQGETDHVENYSATDAIDKLSRWQIINGDCIEEIKKFESRSMHLSIFSPPFAQLYTYTDSDRDLGNSRDYVQFFEHYNYLAEELLRITVDGRRCCTHVQQIATTKAYDGVIGFRDFRADMVRLMVDAGWIYDGEIVIDKCPQAQAIRTKSKALLFVQLHKDSVWSRPAMADYILLFRKPGDNPTPINPDVNNDEWIKWARPVWYDIRENDTLSVAEARDEKDERHICPLQLETIKRCIRLWSNPEETIFSPFAGIGSEGYVAIKNNRKFVGIELKKSYYNAAINNLKSASQPTLFDNVEVSK